MIKRIIVSAAAMLALAAPGAAQMAGGPCEYASHPGRAVILSITDAAPEPGQDLPYRQKEVLFRFTPDAEPNIAAAPKQDKAVRLTLVNGWNPGPEFLKKYGLRQGGELACVLQVITKGTCTPVIYRFPGVDTADYFELEK